MAATTISSSPGGTFTLTGASFIPGLVPGPTTPLPITPTTPAGQTAITETFAGEATPGANNGAVGVNPFAEARTAGNEIDTAVGKFAGLGGSGTGQSVTGDDAQIQIRSGNNFGRFNVVESLASIDGAGNYTPTGNFLDSNDTDGISWTIDYSEVLRSAWMYVTDPNDAGGRLRVDMFVDGANVAAQSLGVQGVVGNGSIWLFETSFAGLGNWSQLRFAFSNFDANGGSTDDGIAFSNPTVNVIPLPAPALMLLSGLGALGGLSLARRRREAASA